MAYGKMVTGQMTSYIAHIDVQKVEVSYTDISLMFKLSSHEIQNLALSFKVAYLGAIVLFSDKVISKDLKRLLKNIANSSSKCCEAVKTSRNAISNLKFQTKDEHKARSSIYGALVKDFEGFSKNAEEIFKKLDKKFKDFYYHRGITGKIFTLQSLFL